MFNQIWIWQGFGDKSRLEAICHIPQALPEPFFLLWEHKLSCWGPIVMVVCWCSWVCALFARVFWRMFFCQFPSTWIPGSRVSQHDIVLKEGVQNPTVMLCYHKPLVSICHTSCYCYYCLRQHLCRPENRIIRSSVCMMIQNWNY